MAVAHWFALRRGGIEDTKLGGPAFPDGVIHLDTRKSLEIWGHAGTQDSVSAAPLAAASTHVSPREAIIIGLYCAVCPSDASTMIAAIRARIASEPANGGIGGSTPRTPASRIVDADSLLAVVIKTLLTLRCLLVLDNFDGVDDKAAPASSLTSPATAGPSGWQAWGSTPLLFHATHASAAPQRPEFPHTAHPLQPWTLSSPYSYALGLKYPVGAEAEAAAADFAASLLLVPDTLRSPSPPSVNSPAPASVGTDWGSLSPVSSAWLNRGLLRPLVEGTHNLHVIVTRRQPLDGEERALRLPLASAVASPGSRACAEVGAVGVHKLPYEVGPLEVEDAARLFGLLQARAE